MFLFSSGLVCRHPNTITGSTNWMEYQVVFNDPADISVTCLAPLATFNFFNPSGSVQFDANSV
jgi:hypothetical protein